MSEWVAPGSVHVDLEGQLKPVLGATHAGVLARAADEWTYWEGSELAAGIRALLAAGQPVPAPVVGVVRRSVILLPWRADVYKGLADSLTEPVLNLGEVWADRVVADLPAMAAVWTELVSHAATAKKARPSARWDKRARALVAQLGPAVVQETILGWLALVTPARSAPLPPRVHDPSINEVFDPFNADALRGLLWTLGLTDRSAAAARALGALVDLGLRKVPGIGPRSPKIANAAVGVLGRMAGDDALAQLARLASRVTFKGTLKEINAALDARAAALGLSRDEVEELAVPTYGLTEVGRRVEMLGDTVAELVVAPTGRAAALTWRNAAGRVLRSPPVAVRRDFPAELAELKAVTKDISTMLVAQAERLDRQFLARRTWTFGQWRERFLDHPLVGTLVRRLLWVVDGRACGHADGALRDLDDVELTFAADAPVVLWHPISREVDEVLAWRGWLERHQVTQPFRQAHREVYLLTAAEERTGVYSNRFAAHVLRQHQFHALAAVRGWRDPLRLMVDDSYPPAVRELPRWGLRAEYWVEGVGDEYDVDTTESGAYLRLVTDQVRFYPLAAPGNTAHASGGAYEQWLRDGADPVGPLALADVPPLVLSEVMRDVDLFVGVASVGNDPTWQDGGPAGRFREYWTSYSFGELSATAQTRRDLLGRLLPRLAVGKVAEIDGRFLRVRGQLREYRIHLGSGNILMEPNGEYLCIVPGRSAEANPDGLFLPFEGDRVLAVILSKAVLLAEDSAITDPTITQQLRR